MTADKTVLITGTSSGIGLAAAVAAAQAGWHTVATLGCHRAQRVGTNSRVDAQHSCAGT